MELFTSVTHFTGKGFWTNRANHGAGKSRGGMSFSLWTNFLFACLTIFPQYSSILCSGDSSACMFYFVVMLKSNRPLVHVNCWRSCLSYCVHLPLVSEYLIRQHFEKLALVQYGSFTFTARAGPVAHPLDLPSVTSIHTVLHKALGLPFLSLIPHELPFHEAVWEYFD